MDLIQMANTLAPFGLKQAGYSEGFAPSFGQAAALIAYNDTSAIGWGDPVKQLSTGYIARWTAGTSAVALAGTFVGCTYLSVAQGRVVWMPYWPGSDVASTSTVTAFIIPASNGQGEFIAQSSGTAIGIADIGANVDLSMGTVNTVTGMSGASLDQTTLATTNTLPLKIVGLYQGLGNGSDSASSYNWVRVKFNSSAVTGV